jgi:hypothetical protein
MTLEGHRRSGSWMGLKGTYFSPAVGIMGFWDDIERLLAPRTVLSLKTVFEDELRWMKRWRRLLVEE